MKDIRQTPQYAKYLRKVGWAVEQKNGNYYFIKKLPLIGAVIKIQRPETLRHKDIELLAKKYRAFQIIIEPKNILDAKHLRDLGFRLSRSPYLPTKTLHLNLTDSMIRIIESMKKDARTAVKKTECLEIKEAQDVEEFRESWKRAVGRKRYIPSVKNLVALKKSFGKNSLFIANYSNDTYQHSELDANLPRRGSLASSLLDYNEEKADLPRRSQAKAGGIFLMGDKMGHYWQAFTSGEGRKELAQYKVVLEGIKWAKNRGAKIFDFEGIYDERFPNKNWKGFTHFKKSFGGIEVEYPGTFARVRLPL
jgi:lipid II:glycine glycyltransferase (peptidoglycan interpeptide bridge formation enzyme)